MTGKGKRACNFFARTGKCKYGSECKFSHDPAAISAQPQPSNSEKPPMSPLRANQRDWSRFLSREELGQSQVTTVIEGAIKMVESGDSDIKQAVIRDLGSDKGLRWIKNMVEADFSLKYSIVGLDFHLHCVPFLRLISHEEILSSLALEIMVGTIYNVIYGIDGQRSIQFFNKVVNCVISTKSAAMQNSQYQYKQAIMSASAALLNTISLNQGSTVQSGFKAITAKLSSSLDATTEGQDGIEIRSARRNVQRIKERLRMGDAIPNLQFNAAQSFPIPDFQLKVDLPGEHSMKGPRHKNDHASIERIKILPTTDEFRSTRSDFLPAKAKGFQHHEDGVYRLLDSQFRLLREDTSGELRDAIGALVRQWDAIVDGNSASRQRALKQINAKMTVLGDVKVEQIKYERRKGVFLHVSFAQPRKLSDFNYSKRVAWYSNDFKGLQLGSLVAIVSRTLETTFLLVVDRKVAGHAESEFDLSSNPERAGISLKLVDGTSEIDQGRIVRLAKSQGNGEAVLVEFPGMLFASFEPVLQCLQNLHKKPDIPFTNWISPMAGTKFQSYDGVVMVPPPLYLTKGRHTRIDLSCITTDGFPMYHSLEDPITVRMLENHTSLDHGQCQGLILSLQKELALVQGPPGTGKSYVGIQIAKVLLSNQKKLSLGPIVCVTYTNHALDQFLEHILDFGENNVIRLGSRSSSKRMENHTLNSVRSGSMKTKIEGYSIHQCIQDLEDLGEEMETLGKSLVQPIQWQDIEEHLTQEFPHFCSSLFGGADGIHAENEPDSEGFTTVQSRRFTRAKLFEKWCTGLAHPKRLSTVLRQTDRQLPRLYREVTDLWGIPLRERLRLKADWEDKINKNQLDELQTLATKFASTDQRLSKQYWEMDKRCLEQAHVIGVTTTGLARNHNLLRNLNAKVLLIEEAAEVLEAHTITALLPSVEHAILIGDHLQLRGQVTKYELSMESEQGKKYGLDESLFERLMREKLDGASFPFATLDVQRRMHPSISSLVRNTLYPRLKDHASTAKYPGVIGIRQRLFWLDHRNREDSASADHLQTSKTNSWEADMVVAFVRHISRQGKYSKGDIAVITPYLGQLRMLKRKLATVYDLMIGEKDFAEVEEAEEAEREYAQHTKDSLADTKQVQKGSLVEGLRLATVDNFQGEEAKIIIVSLVRSNIEKRCGFLKTSNRINVLLSRAQHGMYIIGDAETASGIQMWADVIRLLENEGNIGEALELECPRHPDLQAYIARPEDFVEHAPEGGCIQQCGKRLSCGHMCIVKCHSEMLHSAVKCHEDCMRPLNGCTHLCPKRCWQECGNCTMNIGRDIKLPCGHTSSNLDCHQSQNLGLVRCDKVVVRTVQACGHKVKVKCYVDMTTYRCNNTCGAILPNCGHRCLRECSMCTKEDVEAPGIFTTNHKECTNPCRRSFSTCNHACEQACHPDIGCGPCRRPCEVQCNHSRCSKLCSEPCPPCAEKCSWSCPHRGACKLPCAVPCTMLPCQERCKILLDCGHQCPSICGEQCPASSYCQQCASQDVKDRQVDMITLSSYAEADLDDDPVIFLSCGHFYTASTLDGHLDMKAAYVVDDTGTILEPRPFARGAMKNCPECRSPLRNIHRYNRVVKAALLDESTRRFMAHSAVQFTELVDQVTEWEVRFENRSSLFAEKKASALVSTTSELGGYKKEVKGAINYMDRFLKSVRQDEQPYFKVNNMVLYARRRDGTVINFELENTVIQHGNTLRGSSLKLRVVWAALWNYRKMLKGLPSETIKTEWSKFMAPDIKEAKTAAIKLRDGAAEKSYVKEEIEARVYHAQLTAINRSDPRVANEVPEEIKATLAVEAESLQHCRNILTESIQFLSQDIDKAQQLLDGNTFYSFVSADEKREVYRAMAAGFSGTGHWYICENGHPFTVGECGMPMELARCAECGAPVGGQHHTAATGVQRAGDFEAEFGNLNIR